MRLSWARFARLTKSAERARSALDSAHVSQAIENTRNRLRRSNIELRGPRNDLRFHPGTSRQG
eukprot:6128209-Alexandrium_andersonii.AAC.1